jgi:G:T-mismatch repair DNA endonuclease (very short patch repair protein)
MDQLEYITKNALMICDQGGAPDFFKPTYNTTVKIHGCLVATNQDAIPMANIPSFKVCKLTQGNVYLPQYP